MDSRLTRFLPPITDPAQGTVEPLQHLHTLRQTLATYVPREVIEMQWEASVPPPSYDARRASLLFADVSGFTALSEQHAALGREGAEEVTNAINHYFSAMLEILDQYGGSVLKFGGDALVVAFYQPQHARAAASAALSLQQQMGNWVVHGSLGSVPLRLGIGLGSGTLRLLQLGNDQRREIVLLGQAAEEIARAEEVAAAGEVVAGRSLYEALPPAWLAREADELAWLTIETPPDPPPATPAAPATLSLPTESLLVNQLEALAPYLPEGLLGRLILDPSGRIEGEHRIVTVLFSNVVNLPAYSRTDDGQAAITAVLQDHFITMQEAIARYNGTLNKIDVAREGYKLLALFGAPRAHEDDEARAVLAALAMQEAMPALNARAARRLGVPCDLRQRIGIHSGIVFAGNVGSSTRQEYSVMGDPVNLAARVMGQARPGDILLSAATHDLLGEQARVTELPPATVKGKSEPVALFRVEGWESSTPQFVTRRAPLVGREREMARMHQAVAQASTSAGQALFLYGEAGVGKSRLVADLLPEASTFLFLDGRSLSYGSSIPYHPWRPVLQALLQMDEHTPPHVQQRRARMRMGALLPAQMELFPLLGPILGSEIPHSPTTALLTPQLRQQRLKRLVSDLFLAVAAEQSLLLVMDDVHWIDDVSADLLAFVIRQIAPARILILMLGRIPPEEQLTEHGRDLVRLPFFSAFAVKELGDQEGLALAESLLARHSLSPEERRLVMERACGNPLYIEALADALTSHNAAEVPDTLQGLIMSHVDSLAEPSRRLLQVASVIGRRFDQPVLDGVYPYPDRNLVSLPARLDDLMAHSILTLERRDPIAVYLFRHVLTHEVTYESLLFGRRRELHQSVARWLEHHQSETLGDRLGLLSYHFYQAQQWEEARHYALLAADRAKESYANDAAMALYLRALDTLHSRTGEAPDPATLVRVLQSLGEVYQLVGRFDEALATYEQAIHATEEATTRLHLYEQQIRVLDAKGALHPALEQVTVARQLAEQATPPDPLVLARLETLHGWVLSHIGEYEQALDLIQQAIAHLEPLERANPQATRALANALDYAGPSLIATEKLEEALRVAQRALALRTELEDLRGIASSYDRIAQIRWMQGEKELATETLNQSLEVRQKIGDAFGLVAGLNNRGIIYLGTGRLAEAEASYLESLSFARQIGSLSVEGNVLSNLAELKLAQGDLDAAERYIEEAMPILRQVGDQDGLEEAQGHRETLAQKRHALADQATGGGSSNRPSLIH